MTFRLLPALLALVLISSADYAHPSEPVRYAVIGDYYNATAGTQRVANLVKGWDPDVIISTGDNTNNSSVAEMDRQVGQFYADYGAMLIEATPTAITFTFYSIAGGVDGTPMDTYDLQATKTLFLPLVIKN